MATKNNIQDNSKMGKNKEKGSIAIDIKYWWDVGKTILSCLTIDSILSKFTTSILILHFFMTVETA